MHDITCGLDRCFLCRHCMPEWKEMTAIQKKTLIIKRGKALFCEGEPVRGIYFLYSGVVKIHAPWDDGREMIIRFAQGGDIVGHRGLAHGGFGAAAPAGGFGGTAAGGFGSPAGGQPVYPVSATALEDTVVCFISNEYLELSLKANPQLTYALMQFYAGELQKAEKRMRDLTHMEVKGRIAGALLEILRSFGTLADGTLALKLTRQDIAAYASTTYETVFKFFAELTSAEVIATAGKDIQLLDEQKLEQWANRR